MEDRTKEVRGQASRKEEIKQKSTATNSNEEVEDQREEEKE
jgi:hypothetical protein